MEDVLSKLASFPGRSHRQHFIASKILEAGDEILAVGTAWERGYCQNHFGGTGLGTRNELGALVMLTRGLGHNLFS